MRIICDVTSTSPISLVDINKPKFEKLESVYENMDVLSKSSLNTDILNGDINPRNNTVLGKITGIFCGKDTYSVNGRYYSARFWDEVIGSSTVQSRFKNSTMLGTLEHPTTQGKNPMRLNQVGGGLPTMFHPIYSGILTKNIVFNRNGEGIGEAYLLNTLVGNIILSYMISKDDKGENLFNLYPSSRGYSEDDYIENGIDVMKSNDYDLVAWDLVFNPGIKDTQNQELSLDYRGNQKLESQDKVVLNKIIEKFESIVDTKMINNLNLSEVDKMIMMRQIK